MTRMDEPKSWLEEIEARWARRACSCGDPRCAETPPYPSAPDDVRALLAEVERLDGILATARAILGGMPREDTCTAAARVVQERDEAREDARRGRAIVGEMVQSAKEYAESTEALSGALLGELGKANAEVEAIQRSADGWKQSYERAQASNAALLDALGIGHEPFVGQDPVAIARHMRAEVERLRANEAARSCAACRGTGVIAEADQCSGEVRCPLCPRGGA